MMNTYLFIAAGAMIFLGGMYVYQTKKEDVKVMQISGLITYAGLCILAFNGLKLMTPIFTSFFGDSAATARNVTQVVVILIGAELILKPAFEDQLHKDQKDDKGFTSRGSGNNKKKRK